MTLFSDETWIVTGASRGVGAAIADALWAEGARLVLNGRDPARLASKAAGFADQSRLRAVAGDIGEAATSRQIASAAAELGGPFGIVHNAGVAGAGPMVWEVEPDQFESIFGASFTGGLHLVRAFVPKMLESGSGCLVFVGSGAAVSHLLGAGPYGIAKTAEEYLARQVALEAPDLVSFVWRPGVVDTDMQAEARSAPGRASELFKSFKDDGLLISPAAAAADLIGHLAGDRRGLTGQIVSVPG